MDVLLTGAAGNSLACSLHSAKKEPADHFRCYNCNSEHETRQPVCHTEQITDLLQQARGHLNATEKCGINSAVERVLKHLLDV